MKDNSYFKFHINKNAKKNPHYFMCEDLLVPRAENSNTQRLNMWSNHLNQIVHLKNPDFPKVFTNFENAFGEYSIAHKEAKEDFVIIDKIIKNKYNYTLIIQYTKSKVFDIINMTNCRNISESYGYALNDCIADKNVGDLIPEGAQIYKSDNYDEEMNFRYGRNLKAVYLSFNNQTYEDGIVISESAAEKMTSYKVEETEVSVNTNEIMVNIYGDEANYSSFPKVGDYVKNKVLLALRRVDNGKIFYDFQDQRLREIDPLSDDIFYTEGGTVVDIDFFSNVPIEKLRERNNSFTNELAAEIESQYEFYKKLAAALEKIIPVDSESLDEKEKQLKLKNEGRSYKSVWIRPIPPERNQNKYSDDLAYMWKYSHEYIDPDIRWREDGKSFENVKIKFTLLKENPLTVGSKITGRYGNKGIVSKIVPDEEMPFCKTTGERAEIVLNPLGVLGRLNLSQIQEQYINFMSDHLIKWLKEHDDIFDRENEFFNFMKIINKDQADFLELKYIMLNRRDKQKFFEDLIENGLYVHQYPFFGNINMEGFKKLFIEMPELCSEYEFENIEKPMVMGDLYFVRLKHESSNKSSVRSTSMTNIRNLPAKNTLKKDKKSLISSTPIRLGEMETENLFCAKRPDLVEKLLKYYSTSEDDRAVLIESLLNERDPFNLELPKPENKSCNREILDKYLNLLELELEDDE